MTLSAGTRLGPYEILSPLGAGGMGEVYRARDSKLHRDVAIKVLPESLAADPERLARFEREARVLASLNHPHIASIYGVEDSTSVKALVLELVEGPTLQDRIESGAIPLDEVLRVARQIAEALEAAHEKGIVHRDLKPANVKLDHEGRVKVLDFGLAKALDPLSSTSSPDITHSPTMSLGTQAGMILGTAAYMSPEQARGKAIDRRADIWAFGVVLYEMLAGERLFAGETVSDTLAAVIKEEPDWSRLPSDTPAAVCQLLRRCLKKDPRQRLQAIGEARITLDDPGSGSVIAADPAAQAREKAGWLKALPWTIAFALAILATAFAILAVRRPPAPAFGPVLSFIPAPAGTTFRSYGFGAGRVTVSPDGARLSFSATDQDGATKLWVRSLGSSTAAPVKGTEDAASPFWSPDGRSLGFVADGKLKTVDLSDRNVQILADATWNSKGAWGPADVVLYAPPGRGPLSRISAFGGRSSVVTTLAKDELSHNRPSFLPDGTHFLYTATTTNGGCRIDMGSLGSAEVRPVLEGACFAIDASGYLLFERDGGIYAQPFRSDTAKLSGKPSLLAEADDCSIAGDAILVYQASSVTSHLQWLDRGGNPLGRIGNSAFYLAPKISPAGNQVLVSISDPENKTLDLWSFPATGGESTRLTFGPGQKLWSVWSPDGKYIAYSGLAGSKNVILRKPADGSREAEVLFTAGPEETRLCVIDWSPDGRYLSYDEFDVKSSREENWILPLFGDKKPFRVIHSDADEYDGNFSPDGHWFAYFSYESGRPEVYVVPFPNPGGKYQISHGGGWLVRWGNLGKLFFSTMANRLMEADLTLTANSVRANAIRPLFEMTPPTMSMPLFDVTPDGKKFLVITSDRPESSAISLVTNWKRLLEDK